MSGAAPLLPQYALVAAGLYFSQYRGADKSLARPGRRQANVSVRMAWISFGALPCRKRNLMTARVPMLSKSRTSLTCFRACFLPGRAKDLSAPRYSDRATGWISEELCFDSRRQPNRPDLLWSQTCSQLTGTGITEPNVTGPRVNHTSYCHLVPRLRMSWAVLPLPPMP